MIPWNVIVAGDVGGGTRLRQRLLDAWAPAGTLHVVGLRPDRLPATDLSAADAVVVVLPDEAAVTASRSLLSTVSERGAALLVVVGAGDDDTVAARWGGLVQLDTGDDARLCATLLGLVHRQAEITRLRRDLAFANRFQGGLKTEIARMHDEMQLAAMVQREFLPRSLPSLYGVEFGALWRPAHYVSGDIYDVCRLDDDHVGLFLADAVGHGVPAALMTMVICRSLVTKIISGSSYTLVEPADVLARLNHDFIRRQGRTTRFASAVYAVINCRHRTMRIAGAGHPPPLLFGASGSVQELETSGGLLGIFPDETYDQIEVELTVGDRLVVHSDGFEQAFPISAEDDYARRLPNQRFREAFANVVEEADATSIIRSLSRQVDDQQGSLHQVDDLTFVCMAAGAPTAAPTPAPAPGAPATIGMNRAAG